MTESQRKWLLDLQSKGVKFEQQSVFGEWEVRVWSFKGDVSHYRIPTQPIPDIPDWREVCREMHKKDVKFEMVFDLDRELVINPTEYSDAPRWSRHRNGYSFTDAHISCFRIPQQPLPVWKEEMTEETKPEPPEIPHRELQIQWHEDMLHHLRTGEPMREWERKNAIGNWMEANPPLWEESTEYRRKPETITYYHCASDYSNPAGEKEVVVLRATIKKDLEWNIKSFKTEYPDARFTSIKETTEELLDYE